MSCFAGWFNHGIITRVCLPPLRNYYNHDRQLPQSSRSNRSQVILWFISLWPSGHPAIIRCYHPHQNPTSTHYQVLCTLLQTPPGYPLDIKAAVWSSIIQHLDIIVVLQFPDLQSPYIQSSLSWLTEPPTFHSKMNGTPFTNPLHPIMSDKESVNQGPSSKSNEMQERLLVGFIAICIDSDIVQLIPKPPY